MLFFIFVFWPHFAACGILASWSGIEPAPSALEGGGSPGKSQVQLYAFVNYFVKIILIIKII